MRKASDLCNHGADENSQNINENQPANASTALCNLLGQLIAKRWVMLQAAKRKKNGAEANPSIDIVARKKEHTRATRNRKNQHK